MLEMKYIIVDNLFPVIFPIYISHKDIAQNQNITSAGFIDYDGKVYGFSDTLNLHSNEKDQKIIDRVLIRCSYPKIQK